MPSLTLNYKTLQVNANLPSSIPDEWALRGIQSWKRVAKSCFDAGNKVRL